MTVIARAGHLRRQRFFYTWYFFKRRKLETTEKFVKYGKNVSIVPEGAKNIFDCEFTLVPFY